MDSFQWIIELVDRMSGPAKNATQSLHNVERAAKDAADALKAFDRGIGPLSERDQLAENAKSAASKLEEMTKSMKLSEDAAASMEAGLLGVAAAIAAVGAAAGVAFVGASLKFEEFAVKEMAFRESTMASFELMEGSRAGAKGLYDSAVQFAAKTPFQTSTVIDMYKQLRSGGFSAQEVPLLAKGLSDISAASGFDENAISGVALQLAHIRSKDSLQYYDLRHLTNWTSRAGIGQKEIYDQIAKQMGISHEEAVGRVASGGVDADTGILAVMSAVAAKGQGLGNVSDKLAVTMRGLWSTLQSRPGEWFLMLDKELEDLPGFMHLKGAMISVLDLLNPKTAGAGLQTTMVGLADSITSALFKPFDGPKGRERMQGLIVVFQQFSVLAGQIWDGIGEGIDGFFEGLQPALTGFLHEGFDLSDPVAFKLAMHEIGVELGDLSGKLLELTKRLIDAFKWWDKFSADNGLVQALKYMNALWGSESTTRSLAVQGVSQDLGISTEEASAITQVDTNHQFLKTFASLIPGIGPLIAPLIPGTEVSVNDPAIAKHQAEENRLVAPDRTAPGYVGSGQQFKDQMLGGAGKIEVHVHVDNSGHDDGKEVGRKAGEAAQTHLTSWLETMVLGAGLL